MFDEVKNALEEGAELIEEHKAQLLDAVQLIEDVGKGDFAAGFALVQSLITAARPIPPVAG
jgi:hypothetical protein